MPGELERRRQLQQLSKRAARQLQQVDDQAAIEAALGIRREQTAEAIYRQRVRSSHAVEREAMGEIALSDAYRRALSSGNRALAEMLIELQLMGLASDKLTLMEFQSREIGELKQPGFIAAIQKGRRAAKYVGRHRKPKETS